jgi:uncharacterized protein DUF4375
LFPASDAEAGARPPGTNAAKLSAPTASDGDLTDEENLVLGVMALDREVTNGGYYQFFLNSSRWFVAVILDYLRRIECTATVDGHAEGDCCT